MSQTVLITGASRGIGRATAIRAGQAGWSVAANYRQDHEAAGQTVAAVQAAGGRAVAIQADVTDEAQMVRMFDAAEAAFGPLTAFVNNAGVLAVASPLMGMDSDRIRRTIAVNLTAAILCAREAARRLSSQGPGSGASIVNVSSIAARTGGAEEYVDYAASKGGIDSLTIGLSKELGRFGVRVNAVRPGLIETDMHASSGNPNRPALLGAQTPIGRAGSAAEAAEAIFWLMSPASSYVTGTLIDVGGGR
jgi:NAD(P)-dependent dehydrogenase (short-subunit alcohol dehydrogenase family)